MSKKLEMIYKPVSALKGYAKKAKIHSPEQIEQLKASFANFDFTVPVLVDGDNVIISGHGRVEAALAAGIDEIPVIVRDDLTPEQVRQLRLVENNVVSNKYDNKLLLDEISEIVNSNASFADVFSATGFEKEIDALFDADDVFGEIDTSAFDFEMEDEIEAMEKEATTAAAEADSKPVALRQVFGVSHVSKGDVAAIKAFIANAETSTGETGIDALVALGKAVIDGK